ncbi:hypothetical protein ACV33W_16830 [Pseudomonas aeruginosa]
MTVQYRGMLGGLTLSLLLGTASAYGSQQITEGTIVITGRIVAPPLSIRVAPEAARLRGVGMQSEVALLPQSQDPISATVDLPSTGRGTSTQLACVTAANAARQAAMSAECYFGESGGRTMIMAAGKGSSTTVLRVSYD